MFKCLNQKYRLFFCCINDFMDDGNTRQVNLVGEFKTWITGIGIFYPDGRETQRKGVNIDIEIKPTVLGLSEGRDEVLEKAIAYANEI